MIKRVFDIGMALVGIAVFAVPMAIIAILVRMTSAGPALYWSSRVGRHNKLFWMPKFRSMKSETPALATHLLDQPEAYLTPIGSFLRKTSLDELPQLWCIVVGDMSFVGPRPALYNQHDLIALRSERGIDALAPGLTGWAQINGRDELSIPEKVRLDEEYMQMQSFAFDLRIIILTAAGVIGGRNIAH